MDKKELHNYLYHMTDHEILYKTNPDFISDSYKDLKFEYNDAGQPVYCFNLDKKHINNIYDNTLPSKCFFEDSKIEFIKQSRYSKVPLHYHNYIEMNYVYSGSAITIINGERVYLKEGYVCILDTDVPHTILETTENDIIINIMMKKSYFSNTMLSRLADNSIISRFLVDAISQSHHHNQYIVFSGKQNCLLKEIIEYILCEYLDPNVCTKDAIDAYMIIVFIELLRAYQEDKTKEYQNNSKPYLSELLRYIETNFNSCTLKSVAEQFNFHPNYLSRFIKQSTGTNFKSLILGIRLKKAISLLKNSNMTIEEIAHQIGYHNIGFFYKKFKYTFEMSPKEYRTK